MGIFDIFTKSETPILDKLSKERRNTINIYVRTYLNYKKGIIDLENPVGVPENIFDSFGLIEEHEVPFGEQMILRTVKTILTGTEEDIEKLVSTMSDAFSSDLRHMILSAKTQQNKTNIAASFFINIIEKQANELGTRFEKLAAESLIDQGLSTLDII